MDTGEVQGRPARPGPPALRARVGSLVLVAGFAGAGVGSTVLVGWLLNVPVLKGVLPGLALMQPNTACSIALTGLALLGLGRGGVKPRTRRIASGIAGLAASIGVMTLAEYVSGVDLGIDLLLFGRLPGSDGPPSPGRMSFMTAVCVSCLGVALLLLDAPARPGRGASQALALTATSFALLDLIGYAYGVRFLYLVNAYSSMALHTAIALFVLGVGTLSARPETGLMRRVMADDAGGWLLRNLLPVAVVLPLLLGGVRVIGEEAGMFNPRFGSAVLVLSNIIALLVLLWWNAGRLSDLDHMRTRAEDGVREREAWLRTTLSSIGDAVIATDAEGLVNFMNPVAEAMTGWTQEDAFRRRLTDVFVIVNEATRRPVENPALRALRDGLIVGLANHTILIARDGTERAIDDCAAPIRLGESPIAGSVLVFRDVTARRRADLALANGERRLQIALDAARMAAWEWDPAADRLLTTGQVTGVLGLVPGEEPQNSLKAFGLLHPQDVESHRARITEAIETGGGYHSRFRITRPVDGRLAWIDEWGRADADQPDGPLRLVGVLTDVTERVQAEEEVREARSRLESTLAAGEVGTWEFDVVNNIVRADPNLARMFGVTSEEAAGGPLEAYLRAIHPEDRGRVATAIGAALESGERFEEEYRLVAGGGVVRWVVARGRVERDEAGRAVRLPGVVIDVSGQRRAEEGLRDSEERRRLALDSAGMGAWNIDPDFALTNDDRFRIIFQGSTEPLSYERAFAAIHPDDQELVRAAVAAATRLDDPIPFDEEYRIVHPDGTLRWVLSKGRSTFEDTAAGRRLASYDGTVMDITERKLAERRLAASEERLRFALKAGRMGTWDLDLASGLLTCSETCKANYGKGPSDSFAYEDLAAAVLPEDRPRWRRAVDEAIDHASGLDVEYRTRWPDGSVHWVCVRASCSTDEGGRTVAMSGVSFGIDERKRMEDDLRQLAAGLSEADRRKDEFLATLAHELRNPLAPIRNGLQIMKVAGDDRRAVDESRSLMERQVTHMVRLIDDLMDVSRITRGKMELRRERVELATVVRNAVEASRPHMEESGHELAVTLPARPIFIDADVTRLAQVFSNLLNNAAKYTERGGDISLVADRQGGDVVVTVRDNGVGIPPEMLPRLFVMFTQVDRSLERSQGGLGIGLSLVKTLVEMHGGSVEARSEGDGRGSEFVVRLPVVMTAPTRVCVPEVGIGSARPAATFRILVVDDNQDSARTLARILRLLGNETRTAFDGGEAVRVAEEYRPEVMLLDIGMPVMNGYEVARTIRERPWGRDVVIVALTGWGQEEDRRRSKEAGIDDHLVKPVDPDVLESLLAGLRPGPDALHTPAAP